MNFTFNSSLLPKKATVLAKVPVVLSFSSLCKLHGSPGLFQIGIATFYPIYSFILFYFKSKSTTNTVLYSRNYRLPIIKYYKRKYTESNINNTEPCLTKYSPRRLYKSRAILTYKYICYNNR